jgi:putative ABC transport system permease protein
MIVRANLKEALRSLFSSKQRSLLALIGIVIGIGSVIAMVSIGTIIQGQVLKQFNEMGVDVFMIQKSFGGGGGRGPTQDVNFRFEDIFDLPNSIPGVLEVAPYGSSGGDFAVKGKKEYLNLLGVTDSFFGMNKLRIAAGRQITDLDRYAPFCVLGSETADMLRSAGRKELIGGEFKFQNRLFVVAGILEKTSSGGGMRPPGLNKSVIIHATTASRLSPPVKVNTILARATPNVPIAPLKPRIQSYFSTKVRGLGVEVRSAEELIENMEKQMRLFTLLLGAIGSISLIVGGVGVMNVMLVSVSERRKEIGIRRALGAQREDIQIQFITESVVLCMAGGLIGVLLGIAISFAFAYFSKWDFMVSYGAVVLGILVSTVVGVFFGFYPARQASRLDPITALRGE